MTSKKNVWSIGSLMKFCLYASVNFAVIQFYGKFRFFRGGELLFVIALVMVLNLLFFGFSQWQRRRASRKFWIWFELVGWGMIGLNWAFVDKSCQLIDAPINWLTNLGLIQRDDQATFFLILLDAAFVYGIFPLAVGGLAGWIATWHDRRIERRITQTDGDHAEPSSPQTVHGSPRPLVEETQVGREA